MQPGDAGRRVGAGRSGVSSRSVLVSTMRSATATCFTASMCSSSVAAAVHRIDHGDHAVEPVAHDQIGMRHRGLQHRRGIGEAGGLQHHAAEHHAAVVEIAQQLLQRVDEIAAQRAAQAAALQQHHAVVDRLDQQVVEPDLAELVDDHRGLGERRVAQQTVEQRGLAGAEEAGQHGQRDGLDRSQGIFSKAGTGIP